MAAAKRPAQATGKTRLKSAASLSGDGMTPVMPAEGKGDVYARAFELAKAASAFAGQVQPENRPVIGELVRSMNCY